jgi:glutamate-1-semialdehyde aminotransferase
VGLAGPVRQVRAIVTIIDRQDLRTNSGSFATLAAIRCARAYNLLRLCDCAN